jgi:hypothetical protein
MRALWDAIGDRFPPHADLPGRLANVRMEQQRGEAEAASAKRAEAGEKGARSRWDKEKRADGKRIRRPRPTQGERNAPPSDGQTEQDQETDQETEQEEAAAARAREPDAPDPKQAEIADAWVCRLEREIGRGLAAATPEIRAELEQLLRRPGYGGPDRALAWTVTTLSERRLAGGPVPGSVAYVTRMLGSMPPVDVGAMERARQACPEWGRLLDAAMSLPPGNAPTEHHLADVLLPLRATFLRGELHLEAADEYRMRFVEEAFLTGLQQLAVEVLGAHVLVRLHRAGAEAPRVNPQVGVAAPSPVSAFGEGGRRAIEH